MNKDLQTLAKAVELQFEGYSDLGTEANILHAFRNKINVFARNTLDLSKGYLAAVTGNTVEMADKDTRKLEKTISDVSYSGLSRLDSSRPFGLKVGMDELVNVLYEHLNFCVNIDTDLLVPFRRYLGNLINNPGDLRAITDLSKNKEVKARDYKSVMKDISDCFTNTNTAKKFGDSYPNKAAFLDVNQKLIKINNLLDRAKVDKIMSDLKALEERAVIVADKIVSNEETDLPVSKKTAKVLSDWFYEVAKECEVFSIYMTKLRAATQGFNEDRERVQRAIKNSTI